MKRCQLKPNRTTTKTNRINGNRMGYKKLERFEEHRVKLNGNILKQLKQTNPTKSTHNRNHIHIYMSACILLQCIHIHIIWKSSYMGGEESVGFHFALYGQYLLATIGDGTLNQPMNGLSNTRLFGRITPVREQRCFENN